MMYITFIPPTYYIHTPHILQLYVTPRDDIHTLFVPVAYLN